MSKAKEKKKEKELHGPEVIENLVRVSNETRGRVTI